MPLIKHKNKWFQLSMPLYNWLLVALALFCITLVFVKSSLIDITHDEAYSFYNVKHFWYVEALCTGNTHWFNFAAIKLAVMLGFEKALHLRWLSLLSFCGFIFIVLLWLKSINGFWLRLFAFSIVVLNPYLLDYFSLARGYATAIFFQALSLLLFSLYIKNKKTSYAHLALWCSGLSAIANFNFFYFFVAFAIVYFYIVYFEKLKEHLKQKSIYIDAMFFIAISALVLKALWFITDCSNDIGAYGGSDFVYSTFSGFINGFVYKKINLSYSVIDTMSYVLFTIVAVSCLYGIFNFKRHQNKMYVAISIIVLLMFTMSVINKNMFGVLYPIDRTTFMYFPLWGFVVVNFLNAVLKKSDFKSSIAGVLAVSCIINFCSSYNPHSTYDYPEQADAQKCFKLLDSLGAKKVGIAPELFGVYRNYYQMTENNQFKFIGESINTSVPKGLSKDSLALKQYDYLVLFPPYNLSYYRNNKVKLIHKKDFAFKTGVLVFKVKESN